MTARVSVGIMMIMVMNRPLVDSLIRGGVVCIPDLLPIGSMYAIYGNIYHQYTPNVSIYTIHGSYGLGDYTPGNKSGWRVLKISGKLPWQ